MNKLNNLLSAGYEYMETTQDRLLRIIENHQFRTKQKLIEGKTMSRKFIDYLTETQIAFEAAKAEAEFSEQQKECIEPLQFAYDKAIALITEYDERLPQQLSDGRGYSGSVALKHSSVSDRQDFDLEYYGRILNLRDVIIYKGKNQPELTKAFHAAIDDYEKSCEEVGKEPKQ